MDRSYPTNAQDTEGIRAIILSDDVSDDDSIDDGTECDGVYVETRESDLEIDGDATSDDYCCIETDVDATDSCFH